MKYKLPKYVYPISAIGAAVGGIVLLKDYMTGARYKNNDRLVGKTVIITGANSGIGKETAKELAMRGARVIMACRDLGKCKTAQEEITEASANRSVVCERLDLASMDSIREFTENINNNESHIDILINNAGVGFHPQAHTKDGFEMHLGVNHLGPFLLTNLLLDKLKHSAPSRIINVSSITHKRGQVNFNDLNGSDNYNASNAYSQSKLAQLFFNQELASRLQGTGVTVNALHPGVVKTEFSRHSGLARSWISSILLKPVTWLLMKSPNQGCQTVLYCALSPDLDDVTGKYFSDCKEAKMAPQAMDSAGAKRLWAISEKWTRMT